MPTLNLGRVVGPVGPKGDPAAVNGKTPDANGAITLIPPDLGAASNPNLLDNWYFPDPVNQRAYTTWTEENAPGSNADPKTNYGFSEGYTIDRWHAKSLKKTALINEGIQLVAPSGTTGRLTQILENKTTESTVYTLSVLVASGSGYIHIRDSAWAEYSVMTVSSGLNTVSATVPAGKSPMIQLNPDTNGTITIKACKLEQGNRQTLAHQDANGNWILNDPPPNKALELAKCQRYMVVYKSNLDNLMLFSGKANTAAAAAYFSAIFPQPLRARPTIQFNDINKFYVYDGTNYVPNTIDLCGIDSSAGGAKALTFKCGISGLGVKSEAGVYFSLRNGAELIFDANL